MASLAEADFNVAITRKGAAKADAAYVSGCLFQALVVVADAIHGAAGSWVTNEKGAVVLAASLPTAPGDFAERAARIAGALGQACAELTHSNDEAEALIADTRASITRHVR